MIVDYELLTRIDEKKASIESNPDYYLKMYRAVRKKLKQISNIHSYWMENPELRCEIIKRSGEKDSRKLKKKAREDIGRMFTAWDYLHNQVENSKNVEFLTSENIIKVGGFVEPQINSGFRNGRVSLGLRYVPPNYLKVPELIDNFCREIQGSDLHPIEVGINCHLNIAGIQPFFDGNKRTGRLFQDTIVYANGFPPGVITISERRNYIDCLEEALLGKQDGDLKRQKQFFNYIAGNIESTLDKIVRNMESKKAV